MRPAPMMPQRTRFMAPTLPQYSGTMNDRPLIAVSVPLLGDERRKNWAKVVRRVDEGKATGWAFEGDFIATGGVQDVPAGSVILVYGERGSRTNPRVEAGVYTANGALLAPAVVSRSDALRRRGTLVRAASTGSRVVSELAQAIAALLAITNPVVGPMSLRRSEDVLLRHVRIRRLRGQSSIP